MRPKRIKFTGLIGNRQITDLTHSELRGAFAKVGLREAHNAHALKRLVKRGPEFGVDTLAEFARRFNGGHESQDKKERTFKLVLRGTRLAVIFNEEGRMITMTP